MFDDTCGRPFVRIPASEEDPAIADVIEAWPDRFGDVGLRIPTGPVVMFRATEFLLPQPNGLYFAPCFGSPK